MLYHLQVVGNPWTAEDSAMQHHRIISWLINRKYFLSEVLQIISSEQMKVIPVLYKVTEVELEKNMIYRSITAYVTIHHNDINFDIRLKQALYQ